MEFIIHTKIPTEDIEAEIRENLMELAHKLIAGTFTIWDIEFLPTELGVLSDSIVEDIEAQIVGLIKTQLNTMPPHVHVNTVKNKTVYVLLFENQNTGEMEPSNFISPEKAWLLRPQDAPEGTAGFFYEAAHATGLFKTRGLRVQISKWVLDQDSVEDL